MFLKPLLLTILFSLITGASYAQLYYKLDIPVRAEGRVLQNAWAGGINAAQHSSIDLNGDGTQDWVIFDRTTNKASTFIYQNSTYVYHPGFEYTLPEDIDGWLILKDYNLDGRKDLFTNSALGGIKAYLNVGNQIPAWEVAADPIQTLGFNGRINLSVNRTDLPGIVDIDGDSDLDIISYNFATGGFIEYHQNQSMETNGDADELIFERVERQWGNFQECDCNAFAFGVSEGNSCEDNLSGKNAKSMHVGGKTILALDVDENGTKDLILGHELCEELYFMPNEGSATNARFVSFNNMYPNAENPARFNPFPSAFYEDVDRDGKRDLIVSTNASFNINNTIDFTASSWVYRNEGTDEVPEFELIQKDFLQHQMLDVGEDAAPAFSDYDQDGDLDLFIGNRGSRNDEGFYASLWLLENTGTAQNPSFELVTKDYQRLSELKLRQLHPDFVDFTNDGLPELVLTATPEGATNQAQIMVLENKGMVEGEFSFDRESRSTLAPALFFLDKPFFIDVDEDGLIDILLGKQSGGIEYYRNLGSGTELAPDYELVTNRFAGITERIIDPLIADINSDNTTDLLYVGIDGVLRYFSSFREQTFNTEADPVLLKDSSLNVNSASRLSSNNYLAAADIYNKGKLSLFVGLRSGGILHLSGSGAGEASSPVTIKLAPNPTNEESRTRVLGKDIFQVRILNSLGALVDATVKKGSDDSWIIDMQFKPVGVYYAEITTYSGQKVTRRLVHLEN